MGREVDFSNVVERVSVEGMFSGEVLSIEPGVSGKGTEFDAVEIMLENKMSTEVRVWYPQDASPQKMFFVKKNYRLLGADVSGTADLEDTVGNTVYVKIVKNEYEKTDEYGDGTGEMATSFNAELIEKSDYEASK